MRLRLAPAPVRRIVLASGLLAVVAVAVAGWVVHHTATAQSTAAPATPPAASEGPTVPVSAAIAERRDVPVILRNIGAVQAFQSVLVRARVDGTLEKVLFRKART